MIQIRKEENQKKQKEKKLKVYKANTHKKTVIALWVLLDVYKRQLYNWFLSNAQSLVLLAIVVIGLYLGFKREFSKLIGFLVVSLVAVSYTHLLPVIHNQ